LLDQSHDGSGADLPRDDHQQHIHLTTATITTWRAASRPLSPCLLDRRQDPLPAGRPHERP
jgi:hypothetical protein